MIKSTLPTKAGPGRQFDVDTLLADAQRRTGLSDYGDMWFRGPLEALVHYINTEGGVPDEDVTPVTHLYDMLDERLRLVQLLKDKPEILDEKVEVVGFIANQPRGGSTLSQRLFTQSPQLTSTYFWELFNPLPFPGEEPGDPAARRKAGDDEVASWMKARPEYVGMHPLDSSYYEGNIWLSDRTFLSYNYTLHFNLPSYYDWMIAQDQRPALREHIIYLKLLQHFDPSRKGKKWLLKISSDVMTCTLDAMFDVFPGAKCIQTHRRLEVAIPSLASVQVSHLKSARSPLFDQKEMGARLAHQYKTGLTRMMEFRKTRPDSDFIDIQYEDLVSDPIAQFRKVIEGMGLVCGPADIAAAEKWMSENQRSTHPPHDYKPEDFGVDPAAIAKEFEFYHSAFVR